MNPPRPEPDDLAARCKRAGLLPTYLDVHGVEHAVPAASLSLILDVLRDDDALADGPESTREASGREAPNREAPNREGPRAGVCHLPGALVNGDRIWGVALQLYGLRSARDWGIGDFGGLSQFAEHWAGHGADLIGLSPLHALLNSLPISPDPSLPDSLPHSLAGQGPSNVSPYSPSSRLHLNWLYLDVERVVGFDKSTSVRSHVGSSAFQARLHALRGSTSVDYAGVAALKNAVLRLLHADFQSLPPDAPDARAFASFCADRGASLRRHATFEALRLERITSQPPAPSWRDWPESFRSPGSEAVVRFVAEHADEVAYFEFLEWQASVQLAAVQSGCRANGMAVGLYLDMAVSVDPNGSDAWAHQAVYADGVHIGVPPDEYNPLGQDWGLCPLRPGALRRSGYDLFRRTLAASMAFAGALRIDHVMGLMRLYLIPDQASPRDGAYLHYPMQDLLDIVAEESRGHRCMVIGEDLGTVDPALQRAMQAQQMLSYKVLYFEQSETDGFRHGADYPPLALATVSTHDLPTLAGWWSGRDLELREALELFPSAQLFSAQRSARPRDRRRLLEALVRAGALAADADLDALASAPLPEWLAHEIHAFVAAGAAQVVMIQMEDVHGLHDQANLPGTIDEHPNWRRKLPAAIDSDEADVGGAASGAASSAESIAASITALAAKIDKARRPAATPR